MDEFKKQGLKGKNVWDDESEIERWKAQYHELMEKIETLNPENDTLNERENILTPPPGVAEKRLNPRYAFPETKQAQIFAHLGPKAFQIIDISVGGVAFFSDVSFEPGTSLLLSALGMVALDVEVLDCELFETNPDFMEYSYRVRAKFAPRVNGYLVYVLSREMYLKQLSELEGVATPPHAEIGKK